MNLDTTLSYLRSHSLLNPHTLLDMTIHSLWVINKAGGLVFSRSYSSA